MNNVFTEVESSESRRAPALRHGRPPARAGAADPNNLAARRAGDPLDVDAVRLEFGHIPRFEFESS